MKVVFFIKSRLIFKISYCFYMLLNKHFINKGTHISKRKRYYNAKPSSHYFYVRTKVALNFCICITVPFNIDILFKDQTSKKHLIFFNVFSRLLLKKVNYAIFVFCIIFVFNKKDTNLSLFQIPSLNSWRYRLV